MPLSVILDCDPGHDDAVAILLAARHLEVLGITTVAGNQSLEKVTRNALKVVELAGLTHIPVARGSARPLHRPPLHAPQIHGESGLDGPELPEPTMPLHPLPAVDFIIETAGQHRGLWLVPTGPLTNVARALRAEPRLGEWLAGISLMGGSAGPGNVTPTAEFNIYVDPEAAEIVFTSGLPLKMLGLNLTHQARVTPEIAARLKELGNRTGRLVGELFDFFMGAYERVYGIRAAYLHDPTAVAALIDPSLIRFESMHVVVETQGRHTTGATVCDQRGLPVLDPVPPGLEAPRLARPPNCQVGMELDAARFWDLVMGSMASYP